METITYRISVEDSSCTLYLPSGAMTCAITIFRPQKKKKRDNITDRVIDVFTLFDFLTLFVKEPYITMVALFDEKLGEYDDVKRGTYIDVLGRACKLQPV